ncbi:MAG: PAS domain S-box protein [Anaerolineales bacterium]|nr:PAS domain S-box protein [Anaerolineales bacterium]
MICAWARSRGRGKSSNFETELKAEDDSATWVEVSINPIRDDDGTVTAFLVSATDITHHKRLEEALRKSEKRHRALFDHSKDAILVADASTGMLLDANPQAQALTGRSLDELRTMHQSQLHPVDTFQAATDKFRAAALNPGARFLEMFVVDRDGNEIPVEISSTGAIAEDGRAVVFGVFHDITERRRAELALRDLNDSLEQHVAERTDALLASLDDLNSANVALEKALRHKDAFLANMSHELRTPLTGVLGLAEALQLGVYGTMTERQQESLHQIEQSGRHLLNLINDLLDVAKIDAGKLTLNYEPVFVNDICRSSMSMVRQLAMNKSQHLGSTIEPENLQVLVDSRRLKQVLVNLLSNAVKFTPQGGAIDLSVSANPTAGVVNFTVSDTGIGIREEDLPKLFHPFSQLEARKGGELMGTGLGLSLVLRLAELHGGSVSVQSKPNAGSRFTITLPWQAAGESPLRYQAAPAPSTAAAPQAAAAVLLVEDNPITATLLSDFLVGHGYKVTTATNGAEAVSMVVTLTPDLVLMDVQMRGMDGLEATRRIRAFDETAIAQTPIVALTALAMAGDRERCLAAGMNAYLCKPIDFAELTSTIERILSDRTKLVAALA